MTRWQVQCARGHEVPAVLVTAPASETWLMPCGCIGVRLEHPEVGTVEARTGCDAEGHATDAVEVYT